MSYFAAFTKFLHPCHLPVSVQVYEAVKILGPGNPGNPGKRSRVFRRKFLRSRVLGKFLVPGFFRRPVGRRKFWGIFCTIRKKTWIKMQTFESKLKLWNQNRNPGTEFGIEIWLKSIWNRNLNPETEPWNQFSKSRTLERKLKPWYQTSNPGTKIKTLVPNLEPWNEN